MSVKLNRILVIKYASSEIGVMVFALSEKRFSNIYKDLLREAVESGCVKWYKLFETDDWSKDIKG